MVRFHWQVDDSSIAFVPVDGFNSISDGEGIQHISISMEVPGVAGFASAILTVPKNLTNGIGAGVNMCNTGVILAHDADASTMTGEVLTNVTKALAMHGFPVMRNFCDMKELRRLRLFEKAIDAAARNPYTHAVDQWIVAGLGNGARVAATCAGKSKHARIVGSALLSYPLQEPYPAIGKGGGHPDSSKPLARLASRILFVHAERDAQTPPQAMLDFCKLWLEADVRPDSAGSVDWHMPAPSAAASTPAGAAPAASASGTDVEMSAGPFPEADSAQQAVQPDTQLTPGALAAAGAAGPQQQQSAFVKQPPLLVVVPGVSAVFGADEAGAAEASKEAILQSERDVQTCRAVLEFAHQRDSDRQDAAPSRLPAFSDAQHTLPPAGDGAAGDFAQATLAALSKSIDVDRDRVAAERAAARQAAAAQAQAVAQAQQAAAQTMGPISLKRTAPGAAPAQAGRFASIMGAQPPPPAGQVPAQAGAAVNLSGAQAAAQPAVRPGVPQLSMAALAAAGLPANTAALIAGMPGLGADALQTPQMQAALAAAMTNMATMQQQNQAAAAQAAAQKKPAVATAGAAAAAPVAPGTTAAAAALASMPASVGAALGAQTAMPGGAAAAPPPAAGGAQAAGAPAAAVSLTAAGQAPLAGQASPGLSAGVLKTLGQTGK